MLCLLSVVVAIAILVTYWPVLSAQALSFDDGMFLVDNPLVQNPSWRSTGRFFSEVLAPSTVEGYYLPLAMVSLMLDYAAGGRPDHLQPFHRTALALHVLNTVLVIVLLYLLFGQPWPAALVGLLFGVHPLTVEPVAWVGERKTLLAAFFALACLILYVRLTRKPGWGFYTAALAMYTLALLSKPTSTPLPILLVLLDYWPLRRLTLRAVAGKIPFFVIGAVSATITLMSHGRTAFVDVSGAFSPFQVLLLVCHNLFFYLRKLVWPVGLSSCYPPPQPLSLANPLVLAGVVAMGLLAVVLLIVWRRSRAPLVGWLFFVVAIAPMSGIIRFTWVTLSDKYVYLPVVGLLLLLTALVNWVWSTRSGTSPAWRRRGAVLLAVLVLAGSASVATRGALAPWRDTGILCRHMLKTAPDAPALLQHYGWHLARQGKWQEAGKCFAQVVRRAPKSVDARIGLGVALIELGRVDEAIQEYGEVLRLKPEHARARYNLAGALRQGDRLEEAMAQYRTVVEIDPGFVPAWTSLLDALQSARRLEEATGVAREALEHHPHHPNLHNDLGGLLFLQGRVDEAIAEFRAALRISPDHVVARYNLAGALESKGRLSEAIAQYRRVLQAVPQDANVRARLEAALQKRGN